MYLNLSRRGRYGDNYLSILSIFVSDWSEPSYNLNIGSSVRSGVSSFLRFRELVRSGTITYIPESESTKLLQVNGLLGTYKASDFNINLSDEFLDALNKVVSESLDDVTAIKVLFKSVGILVEYINFDSDSIKIDKDSLFCTKRMAKYFDELLINIPRSEYVRLKSIDGRLVIKSRGKYFKNINNS
jgi:hypothetical protein